MKKYIELDDKQIKMPRNVRIFESYDKYTDYLRKKLKKAFPLSEKRQNETIEEYKLYVAQYCEDIENKLDMLLDEIANYYTEKRNNKKKILVKIFSKLKRKKKNKKEKKIVRLGRFVKKNLKKLFKKIRRNKSKENEKVVLNYSETDGFSIAQDELQDLEENKKNIVKRAIERVKSKKRPSRKQLAHAVALQNKKITELEQDNIEKDQVNEELVKTQNRTISNLNREIKKITKENKTKEDEMNTMADMLVQQSSIIFNLEIRIQELEENLALYKQEKYKYASNIMTRHAENQAYIENAIRKATFDDKYSYLPVMPIEEVSYTKSDNKVLIKK